MCLRIVPLLQKEFDMLYEITPKIEVDLLNRFTYHAPIQKLNQQERYENIRQFSLSLAHLIIKSTPPSREQSLALTNLEQALMWANASIARNESETE